MWCWWPGGLSACLTACRCSGLEKQQPAVLAGRYCTLKYTTVLAGRYSTLKYTTVLASTLHYTTVLAGRYCTLYTTVESWPAGSQAGDRPRPTH